MKKIKLWILNVLNLYEDETTQVLASWGISFVYRVSMVIGWTAMVVFFVEKFGIVYLPLLLALHAFGNILGSLLFGKIVTKFNKSEISIYLSILCGVFFAFTSLSYNFSYQLFLILSIVGVSVLLYQLKIVRSLFSESIFSPSQASRVFPVIESAETLGVIFGGSLVVLLSQFLPVYKFFLIMVAVILMVVPIVFWFMKNTVNVPYREFFSIPELGIKAHGDEDLDLRSMFTRLKNDKFIFSLFGIVIFQFLFFGILEYHFTFVVEAFSKMHAASGYAAEKAFAADLGLLHTVFGSVILVFQLLLASRVLRSLGVIRSMLLMPIVMIVSVGVMIFNFSFPSVVLARFNQELMYVLHYNSYHASYYALSHGLRVAVMEFLEGVVRPLGTILATVILVVFSYAGVENFNLVTNLVSIACLVVILFLTYKFKEEYHNAPLNDLRFDESVASQMNSLDLLESEKQVKAIDFLSDLLMHRIDLSNVVRTKIYSYLGNNGDLNTVYFLIDKFGEGKDQHDILKAINNIFSKNRDSFKDLKFSNFYLEKFYDELLVSDIDLEVKKELLRFLILFYLELGDIDSLLNLVKSNMDAENCLVFSEVLSGELDSGLLYVFDEFLHIDDSKVKMSVLLFLDKYMSFDKVKTLVRSCLVSSDEYNIQNALLYVLKSKNYSVYDFYKEMLSSKLEGQGLVERLNKFVFYFVEDDFVGLRSYLSSLSLEESLELLYLFENWYFEGDVISLIRDRIEAEIYKIYFKFGSENDPDVKLEFLYTLKNCYKILGSQKEYFMLKDLLA